eukprot:EG_transcript_50112
MAPNQTWCWFCIISSNSSSSSSIYFFIEKKTRDFNNKHEIAYVWMCVCVRFIRRHALKNQNEKATYTPPKNSLVECFKDLVLGANFSANEPSPQTSAINPNR